MQFSFYQDKSVQERLKPVNMSIVTRAVQQAMALTGALMRLEGKQMPSLEAKHWVLMSLKVGRAVAATKQAVTVWVIVWIFVFFFNLREDRVSSYAHASRSTGWKFRVHLGAVPPTPQANTKVQKSLSVIWWNAKIHSSTMKEMLSLMNNQPIFTPASCDMFSFSWCTMKYLVTQQLSLLIVINR